MSLILSVNPAGHWIAGVREFGRKNFVLVVKKSQFCVAAILNRYSFWPQLTLKNRQSISKD